MKSQQIDHHVQVHTDSVSAPSVIKLGNTRAELKEIEKHLLRERRMTSRQCIYLSDDEIAEVLASML